MLFARVPQLTQVFCFTRNREVELKWRKRREERKGRKGNSTAAAACCTAKEGRREWHRPTMYFYGRGELGVYDSLRSTILVRHANVEGRNRRPRRALLSRFFNEFSPIALYHRSGARTTIDLWITSACPCDFREFRGQSIVGTRRRYLEPGQRERAACGRFPRACPTSRRVTLKG